MTASTFSFKYPWLGISFTDAYGLCIIPIGSIFIDCIQTSFLLWHTFWKIMKKYKFSKKIKKGTFRVPKKT